MFLWNNVRSRFLIIAIVVLVVSFFLVMFAYRTATTTRKASTSTATAITMQTPLATPSSGRTAAPTPPHLPLGPILGIESDLKTSYPGIPWMRFGYVTCGVNTLKGGALKSAIQAIHTQRVRVLLTTCQQSAGPSLFDMTTLNDAAQSGADAVQCGNEQMKYDPGNTLYIPPADFARYFDLCEHAMHAARPDIPVLLGSLDPHVGGVDYQPLIDQVNYLNAMQAAMNTIVHPGGHWNWRSQTLGLLDSWHNGYPNQYVNSLYGLFVFWAQQFNVDLNSDGLGKHIWVVEGTGCYKGCGLDPNNAYQIAVSHVLTLITDVQTSLRYKVPFFYFSGKDIPNRDGTVGPIGVLDVNGHPKPLRQDLPLGARSLTMSCPAGGQVVVIDQEQLLARLYAGCQLPGDYISILSS